jgi:hypothetical protein
MYPRSLSYFVNRISNYSQNTLKCLPYRTDAVPSGQIVVVDLPTNALIDLRSLAWHFKMTTTASGGTNNFAGAPQNIESIIDKITIEIDGKSLNSSANQNYVYNALLPLMGGTDFVNKRKIYQNGGTVVNATANLAEEPFVISHWLGFLGSVQPDVLDTSTLGAVRISIHLASANVLVPATTTGPTTFDYSLSKLYFTMNTLSIDDGIYYPLHAQYLSSGNVYELPFDNYYTSLFSANTWDNTFRFSLGSQSVDWVAATSPTNYNTKQPLSTSGRGGTFDTTTEGCASYSFNVNGVQFPQYKATIHETFTHAMNSLQQTHDMSNGISPLLDTKAKWLTQYAVFLQSFAFAAGADERVVSGINTKGECCQISFETQSDGSATDPGFVMIIAKTTSILRVGAGRQLEIVP